MMFITSKRLGPVMNAVSRNEGDIFRKIVSLSVQPFRSYFITIREGTVDMKFRDTMDYGIYALTSGYVKEGALEAARLAIVRAGKTKEIIQIPADTPITKKPEGTRMGKGKGKTAYHTAMVKPGRWMFEFNCEDDMLAKEAWRQANFKLPLRLYLRKKPKEPRKVLTLTEIDKIFKKDCKIESIK
eukprot:Seg136.2 transcript_id=Seg136.2/GoldUCD/mRNA.D3Y31 product="50S ribosomal protein L16" pseudo=true protein_id=Seg136.2/GoldUCD/D3Y31